MVTGQGVGWDTHHHACLSRRKCHVHTPCIELRHFVLGVISCCEVMMMISMIFMILLRDNVGSEYHHFHRDDKHLFLHDCMLINIINKNAEGQFHHMTP